MIQQTLLAIALGCFGVTSLPTHERTPTVHESVFQDPIDITGKFTNCFIGNDGWSYFLVDDKSIKIKTVNLPDPIPAWGTIVTASGCTPDPTWEGGYVCTGLR